MKVLIIDNGTKHLGKLKQLLIGNEIAVRPLFQNYTDSDQFDLIILSGRSEFSVIENPEIFNEEINLVKSSGIPIIGICEGCEIIALAYKSEMKFTKLGIKGIRKIEIIDKNINFVTDKFEVFESHHWTINKLGRNLVGIAKSESGYEIIRHKVRSIIGLQFHPEMFVDKTLGDEFFNKILENKLYEN